MSVQIHALLVDDEPSLVEVASMALRMAGIRVTATCDSTHALAILTGSTRSADMPDVLVTDLVMPQMTGVQLIADSRAAGVDIPVLVISSYGTREDLLELLRVGLDEILDKPLNAEQLVGRVTAMASKRSRRKTAVPTNGGR